MNYSYRIFITKSAAAAELLFAGFNDENTQIYRISHGATKNAEELPNMYRKDGLFYAMEVKADGAGTYEITVC